jgi:NAD(P)-dependent dehydrogenase (short-subunit alcohol dehydrogenase family)
MRFAGKTVVITGAASGIGKASVLRFASEGATVIAGDIDDKGGQEVADASGGKVLFRRCDVTNVADIKALMDFAASHTGGIDTVFNNAGAGGDRAGIDEIEPEGWDFTMNLLLRSVAMGMRYAIPHMKGRAGASFVNTASIAALGAGYSPTAYAVAKMGVLHLSKVAAADLAKYNIRCNAICPGFIKTNIFTSSMEVPAEAKQMATAMIFEVAENAQPVKGGGNPEDIASMAAYLASDEARFITGTHFVVDGGITIGPRHSWDEADAGLFGAIEALAGPGAE